MTIFDCFSWVACFGSVLGTYWCGKKIIWCWPLWIVSSAIWIVLMTFQANWAAVVMFSCYEVFNVLGWRKWIKTQSESTGL